MLELKFIREHFQEVKENLGKRKDEEKIELLENLIELDKKQRETKIELDNLRNRRNIVSEEINEKKKKGEDVSNLLKEVKELPNKIKEMEDENEKLVSKIKEMQMRIPNMLHESVPYGESDEKNKVVRTWGEAKTQEWSKSHVDLLEELDLADMKKAAEVSGARFYYLKNDFVLLELALINYALDKMSKKDFTPICPPFMLRKKIVQGATDLGDFEDVIYKIEGEDLYMIPTAEHAILGYHSNEVIPAEKLPLKYAGWSPCFRKEAGAHGKDTKGLFRLHQFNKVEMFVFCKPEDSWKLHEEMIAMTEEICQELGLPYRIVNVCTGDIGIVAAKKYDLEVWMPLQKKYRELMSCTNATTYQAVRSGIRYEEKGERNYVHTLNNTVIATERTMVAILENFQQKDGSIKIPDVLVPYMGGKKEIRL